MNSVNTGIEFDSLPGQLPTFLIVNACNASNYHYFTSWKELHPQEQAFLTAHYIANSYVEQHKSDAEAREVRRKSKSKG